MVRICDIGEGAEGGSRSPRRQGDAKELHVSLTSCKIFEKMRRCHHQHRIEAPGQLEAPVATGASSSRQRPRRAS